MIFDIYEQTDLYAIAGCQRRGSLIDWLNINRIPFITNSKERILAHKSLVDAAMGVIPAANTPAEEKVTLGYGTAEN